MNMIWIPSETGDRLCLDGWPIEIKRGSDGMALYVENQPYVGWSPFHTVRNLKVLGEAKAHEMAEFSGLLENDK